ncbi:MAG: DUF4040 domain-containing protein [Firmicutes bacterium]|nr:DUF4040 domain-containing protein [Bacillota bacterium]
MMIFFAILIIIALCVTFVQDLLYVVIIFGVYSLIMALLWLHLNSPDLAITEAAAGIGVTTLMITLIRRTVRREN